MRHPASSHPDLAAIERGRLIGRQQELRTVEVAVARLSRARGGWLVLSGEPGVGKTRLLGELLERSAQAGHIVLSGRGAELERDTPFGIWIDALDDHVASLGDDQLRRLVGDRTAELSRVLPSVRAPGLECAPALQTERYQAHRAVRLLLERLAARRPVVVALDDLHWADDASLELVAHLLRRPVEGSLLVVVAFREGQLPSWLGAPLESAERDGSLDAVAVSPLSATDADALLGDGFGSAARARLYELSGGNPFYLEQLGAIASRDPRGFWEAGDAAAVPAAVAAALGQQVACLSTAARALVWGAAVAGDPVDLALAAATAGIGEDAARESVDELLSVRLLARTDTPSRYRFRHPIVRQAVYEAAGEGWRLAAHARAADALAERHGSASARAHHVERVAGVGDEQAIALLIQAGGAAAARAPAGAARWYRAALRLLPQDESAVARRLELLVPMASALVAAGCLEQGLNALLDALELVPTGFGAARVRLIGACAGCENLLGRHDAAHARLLAALAQQGDHASADAAALQVELAADAIFDTDFDAALDWAERALVTARQLRDPALTAVAAALGSFAAYTLGRLGQAEHARVEAVAALDSIDDDVLAGRLDAPYYLGFAEFFCERYDDAIGHLQRGIAVSRVSGQGQYLVAMMVGLAFALQARGRLAAALEMAQSAVEAARLADNPQMIGFALLADAWTAAMSGNLEQAVRAGEEALASIEGLDESVLTRANRETVAAAFIQAGDPERGLRQAQLAGAPEFLHVDPGRRSWLYALLAQAELALGRRTAAEDWLVRGEQTAHRLELPLRNAELLHTRAMLLLHDGEPHPAADTARRAIEQADSVGAAIQSARSRALLGAAIARAGRREDAVALLRGAEATLADCGAQRLRAEAARELRRLGRRPTTRQLRAAGGEGLDALSGREREIADLVARGHTNRKIAAQLFLSDKTVETHLTRVFVKLRVASRAEVAELIGRSRPTAA
jgi:DNA-binding CsgD family transcriptional regulator